MTNTYIILDKTKTFHQYNKKYQKGCTYYHCKNNPLKYNSFIMLIYVANLKD